MQSFCIDWETNTTRTSDFIVRHERKARGSIEKLSDPRDIYELTANYGARRMRSNILAILPIDLVEEAVKKCKETMVKEIAEKSPDERIREMLLAFSKIGVDQKMIEKKLGHAVNLTTVDELGDLRIIYQTINDKQGKREDFFEINAVDEIARVTEPQRKEETNKKLDEIKLKLNLEYQKINLLGSSPVDLFGKIDSLTLEQAYNVLEACIDWQADKPQSITEKLPQAEEKSKRTRRTKAEMEATRTIPNQQDMAVNSADIPFNPVQTVKADITPVEDDRTEPEWYLDHEGKKCYAMIEKLLEDDKLNPVIVEKLVELFSKELTNMDHVSLAQSFREAQNGNFKNLDQLSRSRTPRKKA
jgi:hypothetical protein